MYHHQHQHQSNSFSMVLAMANGHRGFDDDDEQEMYGYGSAPAVDCTLSLGTPSTRLSGDADQSHNNNNSKEMKKRSSYMSGFGWNILPKNTASSHHTAPKGRSNGAAGDPLLARRCANCDTTSTPLWRNGPRGPKSLCNACGIRFKKEERRATAAAATGADAQYMMNTPWPPPSATNHHHKTTSCYPSHYPGGNEFRFSENDGSGADADAGGIPFLSWRFNVTDRASFVHDFTR
ncbi:GATA transcription factor 18-like [Andrographis paniculata]|uniref:GATA transcription factor 18-like n=1 Tax=Andrographis paniculata TaxID=175694 RepID=UPI0021E860D7|nr:GATA transcription factor 18-like [Andrographis paniculata]